MYAQGIENKDPYTFLGCFDVIQLPPVLENSLHQINFDLPNEETEPFPTEVINDWPKPVIGTLFCGVS